MSDSPHFLARKDHLLAVKSVALQGPSFSLAGFLLLGSHILYALAQQTVSPTPSEKDTNPMYLRMRFVML